jgi:peptidoglycan/LPS O-acetylase OafA/YrhL
MQDMPDTISPSSSRVLQLDGIRGFAILLVVLYHYVAVSVPVDAGKGFLFLRQVFSDAWSGVDLFFVLSGFLIAGILIDNRTVSNYFQIFYSRRVSRIFPLYYLFLLLFLLLRLGATRLGLFSESLFASPLPIFPYFVYLQNLAMAIYGTFGNEFLAITWSLAIEEQFYLFLPLVIRWSSPRKLPLHLVFFVCLSVGLRAALGAGTFLAFVFTPWRLDGLFLGALLAVLWRTPTLLDILKSYLVWIKVAFVALLLYVVFNAFTEPMGSLDHLFIFGLFYATLILLSLIENSNIGRFFCWSPLRYLGQISYGIYLFHQMVNGLIHDLIFKSLPSFHSLPTVLVTLLALVVTCLIAHGTYVTFEKRFIDYGQRRRYSETAS